MGWPGRGRNSPTSQDVHGPGDAPRGLSIPGLGTLFFLPTPQQINTFPTSNDHTAPRPPSRPEDGPVPLRF